MPYTLVHDGLTREFDFFAPTGWPYWVARAWQEERRVGLPLVVALHGAAQEPLAFQKEWFFPYAWTLDLEGNTQDATPTEAFEGKYKRPLDNQFFVLYPYGFGWASRTLQSFAYDPVGTELINIGIDPQALEEGTVRGWNSGINGVTTGPGIDDVGFIQEMIRVVGQKLRKELESMSATIDLLTEESFPWLIPGAVPVGVEPKVRSPEPFDKDRRFLFGYSNGGILAHRLVRQMPNYWAAVWGMSTTVGGKPQKGLGDPLNIDAVVNLPEIETGTHSTSFFAHHGELDEIAPPGTTGNVLNTGNFELQTPIAGSAPYNQYLYAGFTSLIKADGTVTADLTDFAPAYDKIVRGLDFLPGFLPLAQGWRGYIAYNGLVEGSVRRPRRGLEDYLLTSETGSRKPERPGSSPQPAEPQVPKPGSPSRPGPPEAPEPQPPAYPVYTAYEYASDDASANALGEYPYTANPICVMYIDENMKHTNFANHPDRYFFAFDVWRFFRTHPRVLLELFPGSLSSRALP